MAAKTIRDGALSYRLVDDAFTFTERYNTSRIEAYLPSPRTLQSPQIKNKNTAKIQLMLGFRSNEISLFITL